MDGRLKQISHLCLDMTNKNLLLGTEGGNIYTLNLTSFSIEDSIIYQDIVIQNSTDEFKVNPGAVEALQVHPTDVDKLLIGKSKKKVFHCKYSGPIRQHLCRFVCIDF